MSLCSRDPAGPASARLEATNKRIEELTCQLQYAEGRVEVAMYELQDMIQRAISVERAATEVNHERAEVMAHAHDADARAEEKENRTWEAEARAREAVAQAREAEV